MAIFSMGRSALACLIVMGVAPFASAAAASVEGPQAPAHDHVAVAIVAEGQSIVLATRGLPHNGSLWRFRSLDTSDLPQPIREVQLASTGTKLFLQPANSAGVVLDLTRQHQHNVPMQYVNPLEVGSDGDARGQSHRLPRQRFISVRDGMATVVDDAGALRPDYPIVRAAHGVVSGDAAVMYAHADGRVSVCGEHPGSLHGCRELTMLPPGELGGIMARTMSATGPADAPRFVLLTGPYDETRIVDAERGGLAGPPLRRAEASLRALLLVQHVSIGDAHVTSLVDALIRESAATWASGGRPITDWRFFSIAPDEELYAPVLQFARIETVFPSAFATLEELGRGAPARTPQPVIEMLYQRYLRHDPDARRASCTFYFRTHSAPGSWIIEYWFYYPFDAGGLGAHAHDPEHMFVEVDKLGGAPRRMIGAGHGYMAGNNIYRADRPGAHALGLPLFAIVELGKHAMAPDVDRDGVFTPGIDENEYRERAKIWGVRDVIGRINNQLLAFDVTMSVPRRPEDSLALASVGNRFPRQPDLAARPTCRLQPIPGGPEPSPMRRVLFRLSDWIIVPPCHEPTSECARLHITSHPDFLDLRTILKEWSFPESFLRAGYGVGPRRGLHSVGLGYAMDLDRVPLVSRVLPLPGRLGAEVFHWRQSLADADRDSCFAGCARSAGVGWGLRYEQFLSNLFGIFSAARVYSPPAGDVWITFGPFVEVPLGRRSNVNLQGGLSFRPFASPRFELKATVGLWKPKTNHVGMRAGKDHRSK